MKTFFGGSVGKTLLLHLTVGDDVLRSVQEACSRHKITTGILTSGIGSLNALHYHYILSTDTKPEDKFDTVSKALELVSLQGVILNGEPHLHVLASEAGSRTYSGHLEEGTLVQYLVEISILEVSDLAVRRLASDYRTVTEFVWIEEANSSL